MYMTMVHPDFNVKSLEACGRPHRRRDIQRFLSTRVQLKDQRLLKRDSQKL